MRIAVIGAGAAGLVTAREALRAGLHPTVFEQGSAPGGVWSCEGDTDADAGARAALYNSLRTNLPRCLMAFRDFPFDDAEPTIPHLRHFPGHAAVSQYLKRFASSFGLVAHIRFNVQVARVSQCQRGWSVAYRRGNQCYEESYDAVAVCTGHYAVPFIPSLRGAQHFKGQILHSHSYRSPAQINGVSVLLIGAGSSGVDLAVELAQAGFSVTLAAREHMTDFSHLPAVKPVPAVDGFSSQGDAVLVDGCELPPADSLIYCTGYRYRFPFLEQAASPNGSRALVSGGEYVSPLYRELLWLEEPTLCFVGLPFKVIPFPQFEIQAKYWIGALTGKIHLPSVQERQQWLAQHERRLLQAGIQREHWLQHGKRQFDYYSELAAECDEEPLPEWLASLNEHVSQLRKQAPDSYRDRLSLSAYPCD